MNDSLHVKVDDVVVGGLVFENGEYIFSYQTQEKTDFISLTMPVRTKDYSHINLHPIFEMHLPEGYLLSIIKKHFSKITKTDDFGLLQLMSPSIVGRVSYESHKNMSDSLLTLDELLHSKDEKLFDELVERFALSSALSGVQPKIIARVQNKATLKLDQYIVKSWGEDYKELSLNEYYCMKVVQYAGVPTPEFYLSDDEKLFIMKRFDILESGEHLGFEDMCVLQAKQREDKYSGSYEQVAKTIQTFVSGKNKKTSLINFYKMIIINNLLKNGDAHLKNFGLIYSDIDNISLAPAYDVISTTVYIKNDVPALHLLGSKKWWERKFLLRFGIESCLLSNKEVNEYYDECLSAMQKVAHEIEPRISSEKNGDKRELLEKLYQIMERI